MEENESDINFAKFQVRVDSGTCSSFTFSLSRAAFEGEHLITVTYQGGLSETASLYLDNSHIQTNSPSNNRSPIISDTSSIIVGGDDLGNDVAEGLMLGVAIYSQALTLGQVEDLHDAFLPNSDPVVLSDFNFTHAEDANTLINFSLAFFDFEESSQTIDFNIVTRPSDGIFSDNSGDITTNGVQVDGDLMYRQNTEHLFDNTDEFVFTVTDGFATSGNSNGDIIYTPTNDDPVIISQNFSVPEGREREVKLIGQDLLDKNGAPSNQPVDITINSVGTTANFGTWKFVNGSECNNGNDITFPETLTVAAEGDDWVITICYLANPAGVGPPTDDGIIGTDTISYFISDGDGADSAVETSTMFVTSVINVGCDEFGEVSCMEVMEEDTEAIIELQGFDAECDDKDPVPAACVNRSKTFIIFALPEFAEVYVNKTGFSEPQLLTAQDLEDSTDPAGYVLLDQYVNLVPNANYFNMAIYESCNANPTGTTAQSNCADPAGSHNPCSPPSGTFGQAPYSLCDASSEPGFTADYTTSSMSVSNRTTLGLCDNGVDEGCPIELFYRVRVGVVTSPLNLAQATPATIVWVLNNEDDVATTISDENMGIFREDTAALVVGADDGLPIVLDDVSQDATNMRIDVDDNQGDLTAYSINQEASDAFASTDFVGVDFFIDDSRGKFCIFSGCRNTSLEVQGVASKLNFMLKNMRFIYNGQVPDGTQESIPMFMRVIYPYRITGFGSVTETRTLNMLIGIPAKDSDCGIICDLRFIAIASSAGILILMCLISYMQSAGHCCFRRARAFQNISGVMNRSEGINRRNGAGVVIEHEVEHAIHSSAQQVKKAGFFLWMFSALCPCCCTYDKDAVNRAADEHAIARTVADDLRHKVAEDRLPAGDLNHEMNYSTADPEHIFNWEKHTTIKDGRQVTFYYNRVTDKSQWHSPFPNREIRAANASPHPPSKGGKGGGPARFAPHPPNSNGGGPAGGNNGGKRYQARPPPRREPNV